MADEPLPWDQLPDEPKEAYVRFLIFLNLGPARSCRRAYDAYLGDEKKGSERPGNWQRDCANYRWLDRARDYDIASLRKAAEAADVMLVAAVTSLAGSIVDAVASGLKPGSRTWTAVLRTYETITSRLPPGGSGVEPPKGTQPPKPRTP